MKWTTWLRLAVLGAFLTVCTVACGGGNMEGESTGTTQQPAATPVTVTINILGNRFDTQELTVPVGSTVIWHNTTSADHVIQSPAFCSNTPRSCEAALRPGQDYPQIFNVAGTFEVTSASHPTGRDLRCTIHVQ